MELILSSKRKILKKKAKLIIRNFLYQTAAPV